MSWCLLFLPELSPLCIIWSSKKILCPTIAHGNGPARLTLATVCTSNTLYLDYVGHGSVRCLPLLVPIGSRYFCFGQTLILENVDTLRFLCTFSKVFLAGCTVRGLGTWYTLKKSRRNRIFLTSSSNLSNTWKLCRCKKFPCLF